MAWWEFFFILFGSKSKENRGGFFTIENITDFNKIHKVINDAEIEEETLRMLEKNNLEVVIAG